MQDTQKIVEEAEETKAAWKRPTISRIDIKRTLAATGSQFDGGNSMNG